MFQRRLWPFLSSSSIACARKKSFSFDSQYNHSETLRFNPQNATRTRKESIRDTRSVANKSRARVNAADLHKLYSEHIFRKPIRKTHTRRNVEKRKRLNFCGIKDEMTTNKLEYYVPESVRMLRILHLMFAHADSPDRMSI